MGKKIIKKIKIQKIMGGKATPAPPIGPILGSSGVNIMEFCKKFNEETRNSLGKSCPVIISVYEDKSFSFIIKKPPVSLLLLNTIGIEKGSKESNRIKMGKINLDDVLSIAKSKMNDLNCSSIDAAVSMICGTAKSMGIEIDFSKKNVKKNN
ncbi:50S ribosomal protein L11 [Blattabacterium cuenoti]|uniref:50S ribosomal protein L11 n=1 Tax=Blattabacterium cuenoti TaxID=1653831 RepID=UPI00163C150A|nr:50S ribosomal protein L11 [Blattabacterium cuenoti]